MSTDVPEPGDRLRHAARVAWPNLPVLLIGSLLVAAGWSVIRVLSPQLGWATVVGIVLLVVPPFAALLRGCEVLLTDEHFGGLSLLQVLRRVALPAARATLPPLVAVLITVAALELWRWSAQTWMLASAAFGAAVSALILGTTVIALPYLVRTGTGLREGWLVAAYIATRNPVPVLGVMSAVGLGVWGAAHLSFALVVLLPAPLALVWAAAAGTATDRSQARLASAAGRHAEARLHL